MCGWWLVTEGVLDDWKESGAPPELCFFFASLVPVLPYPPFIKRAQGGGCNPTSISTLAFRFWILRIFFFDLSGVHICFWIGVAATHLTLG